jgi:hypothetical protein
MMNQLLSNTEAAAKALVERVVNVQGEEVTTMTSHIVSAIDSSTSGSFPDI